jgi:hypothetical protein
VLASPPAGDGFSVSRYKSIRPISSGVPLRAQILISKSG